MRLENILALTHAKLLNEPFVKSFENIVFDAHKIKRGDLFLAFDETTIETAIVNGAYGIIFDKPVQIRDNEIAWIKVEDIEDALKRLLRFRLIEKEVVAYECNEVVLKLALQIITESNFVAISGDIKSIAKTLWNVENKSIILFCPALCDKELIFTDVKSLPKSALEPITIMEQTLFETSFIYDNVFYERQLISPFFMPFLEELLHLLKSLKISFRLKKFTNLEHFQPVFTNKNFEIKEFGTSDKVLIFESNATLIKSEISFLQNQANWAKAIYIIPYDSDYEQNEHIFIYKTKDEIMDILRENDFHFALIAGVDKSILNMPVSRQTQLTLDF